MAETPKNPQATPHNANQPQALPPIEGELTDEQLKQVVGGGCVVNATTPTTTRSGNVTRSINRQVA